MLRVLLIRAWDVLMFMQAQTYTDEVEKELVEAMGLPKTLAWGEIGLDYHYNLSDPEKQREVFARQIQLAVQHNKPLVIHTREAEEGAHHVRACGWLSSGDSPRMHRHISDNEAACAKGLAGARPLLHVVPGHGQVASQRMAQPLHRLHWGSSPSRPAKSTTELEGVRLYLKLTIPPQVITFGSGELTEVVRHVPLERILLETDGPYMTPAPFRFVVPCATALWSTRGGASDIAVAPVCAEARCVTRATCPSLPRRWASSRACRLRRCSKLHATTRNACTAFDCAVSMRLMFGRCT